MEPSDLATLSRVVLDTSACVYYLDRPLGDPRREAVAPLVKAAEAGAADLIVSSVTATELLVQPLRRDDRLAEAVVRLFIARLCRVRAADFAVAETAAALRAAHGLATPDAIICATGVMERADAVIGNDARWKRLTEVRYVHLDDLPPPGAGAD